MTTINLYQSKEAEQRSASEITANAGFIFSLSILIITFALLAGFKVYHTVLDKQNAAYVASLKQQADSLVGLNNLQKIYNIQTRTSQIKANLLVKDNKVNRVEMTKVLDHLGSDMSSGAVVKSYEFTADDKIKVTFIVTNFADAAKQVSNFKKSNYFTNANLTNISKGEKDVQCEVTMNIKK